MTPPPPPPPPAGIAPGGGGMKGDGERERAIGVIVGKGYVVQQVEGKKIGQVSLRAGL